MTATPSDVISVSSVVPFSFFHFSVSSPFNDFVIDDCFDYIFSSFSSSDEDNDTTTPTFPSRIDIGPSDIASDTTSIHHRSFYVMIAVCVLLCLLVRSPNSHHLVYSSHRVSQLFPEKVHREEEL